jgi:FkbM family methyltransferase
MTKFIVFFVFQILNFCDSIIFYLFKRKISHYIYELLRSVSYTKIKVRKKIVSFFAPNTLIQWRINTFYSKEPETLEWIDSFSKSNIIFWDIGANIGLYSIYAALKHKNIEVICFEPSSNNLGILTRNVSINKLTQKILINPFPLSNKENMYLLMKEKDFIEGGALNTFGENLDFEGKKFFSNNNYKIYGTTINYLIKNKILEIPDYIKIDVDGIEHLILEGANKYLSNKKIKGISIELNENFKEQFNKVMKIMSKSKFILKHKKHAEYLDTSKKFSQTFNYIFERN